MAEKFGKYKRGNCFSHRISRKYKLAHCHSNYFFFINTGFLIWFLSESKFIFSLVQISEDVKSKCSKDSHDNNKNE